MDIYLWAPIIIGISIALIIWGAVRTMSDLLQKKFVSINPLRGKTFEEISNVVGPPNSIMLNNKTWTSGGYSITLSFDNNNICLGVISEHKF